MSRTVTFAPYAGDLYVRLTASNTNTTGDNYLYIDNIDIQEGNQPTCYMPRDIYITNKTSTGFTLNWIGVPGQNVLDYEWEVRTSGLPGSGSAGLVQPATPAGLTTDTYVDITGLTAGVNYKVYVRSNCSSTDSSFWAGLDVLTHCNAPNFSVTTPVNVCGIQNVKLTLTGVGGGTAFWYDEKDSLVEQGANSYDIPMLDESRRFKVFAGNFQTLADTIGIGMGITSAAGDYVPFTQYEANKVQYIYMASELQAEGFTSGIIKAFGFRSGPVGGTLPRNNFTIHMGETILDEFGDDKFVPSNRLTLVKNAGNDTLKESSINMFTLDTPFIWDGISNLVVQITYSDVAIKPMATSAIFTSFAATNTNRTLYASSSSNNLSQMTNVDKGTLSEFRVNGYFDVLEGCFGLPKTIEVNFKSAPKFVLSDSIVNNCSADLLQKIYVLTCAADFDEYEWIIEAIDPLDPNDPANDDTHPNHPDNAINGDHNIGWTFNPATPAVYYLTAKQSNTFPGGESCVNYAKVTVQISPSPTMLQLHNNYSLCYDDIEELKVDNFVDETPSKYLFNGNLNGVTINNTVTGDAISNSTRFSEGNGSLLVSYAAQTSATVDFDDTINMYNLKSIVIEFDHIAALQATNSEVLDYAYIEYSTDNGSTWKLFLPSDYIGNASNTLPAPTGQTGFQGMFFTRTSYTDWGAISSAGGVTNSMWKSEKFVVPADEFTGSGTFKVRFRIGSDGNT